MHYHRIVSWVLLVILTLGVPGALVRAQGPGELRPLVAADGSFSMSVPAEWVGFEAEGMYIVATDNDAMANILDKGIVGEGQVVILAIGPAAIWDAAEVDAGADAMTLASGLVASLTVEYGLAFDAPVAVAMPDRRNAVYAEGVEGGAMDVSVLVLDDGSGDYLGMVLLGDSHAIDEETLFAMILSLQLGAPGPCCADEEAELLWLVVDPFVNIDGAMDLLDANQIVVSDGGDGLLVYTVDGKFVTKIQDDAMFTMTSPGVDADGNIWAADMFNGMVAQFSPDGTLLQSFGGDGMFGGLSPEFLMIGPDGTLYLSTYDDQDIASMHAYTPQGDFRAEFPVGDADSFIWTMDMGPDGRLYVVDLGASAIRVYDLAGELLDESFAQQATAFAFITAFAALDDGTYLMSKSSYVDDEEMYVIVHLDADGNVIGEFTAADLGLDMMYAPLDFVLLPGGDVIVAAGDVDGSQLFRMQIVAVPKNRW